MIIFALTIMTFAVYYLMLSMIKKAAENARLEADQQKSRLEADALRRSNEMKEEFVNNLSHELQAPLTVMTGFAQYTSDIIDTEVADPSQIKENMRQILFETGRTERLVLQLLDASALENGQFIMNLAPVDVAGLIEKIENRFFGLLDMNGNRLTVAIQENLPLANADEERLLQVLVNLVSNAVKHTYGGDIAVSASEEGDMLALSVSDNGDGVEPEILGQIFRRYPGKRAGRAGTGLGLYICKQIIDAHGGQISMESAQGEGTTVKFTLPAIASEE
jgi:signal transduction histidine kinase